MGAVLCRIRAFVRNVCRVCMRRGHRARGREGPFCVKAKEGARHWRTSGQEQVPTAQQSPHMANALGRRAQDPGVELWQGGSHVVLSLWLEDVLFSTVQKVLGLWVHPAGHLIPCCDPQSHHGAKPPCLCSVQGDRHSLFEHNHGWTKAWPCRYPVCGPSPVHRSWEMGCKSP